MKHYICPFTRCGMNFSNNVSQMNLNLDEYTYPDNFNSALKLIEEAISGEREDELFYDYLIKNAPENESKKIISGIRDNEKKHNKMFRFIYYELAGNMIPSPENVEFNIPNSFCNGIKRALNGELNAVIKYRKILFALNNRKHINMLIEIITDELRHASLYNFIYTSNCSKEQF
ncbi:ferritin family protein [Clostridium ljungdahlii]|uniref:Rubrerythrin n=1 Tax=Clostridium ljungdahlii TaxID=1538 RepID=A0A162L871_9CLOT|nr:ferritin family protein [Clostridium ljungdahlii]OAA90006.1 Rubrerythrin [Clostridium ljungdahlii]